MSHHVRWGKIAHHKWILATLYSFTHLKTKSNIKGRDKIGDMLHGQFPLYDKTSCEYSRLSSPREERGETAVFVGYDSGTSI